MQRTPSPEKLYVRRLLTEAPRQDKIIITSATKLVNFILYSIDSPRIMRVLKCPFVLVPANCCI